MSNLNRHPLRRSAVGVLAGTLAFSGAALGVGVSPANAQPGFDFKRLAGNDRYGTAAAIAADTFVQGADTVVLASGRTDDPRTTDRNESNFPDALTGNFLAGDVDGPILLTATDDLPKVTEEALETLEAQNVIIVGETNAVSQAVEDEVEALGYDVTRIGGQDRYDTAAEVARFVAGTDGSDVGQDPDGDRTAVLGNGQNFPDILAAGPLGYANQFPITITPNTSNDLDSRTASVLRDLDIEQVIIVGGPAAVSEGVEQDVEDIVGEGNVIRLAGQERFETAIEIAEYELEELNYNRSHINLARSDDFADALSGGPHAGRDLSPILITRPDVLRPSVEAYLNANACALVNGHIFGGFQAISPEVAEQAEDAAQGNGNCPAPGPELEVSTDADDTRVATPNPDATETDDRTYEVSGLIAGQTYRITLVRCENVTENEDGTVTFAEDGDTGFADTGNPTADIISVNGIAITDQDTSTETGTGFQSRTTTFTATGETAEFTIDGDEAPENVLPVVYFDNSTADETQGGDSPRLELDENGVPTEDFDIGGCTHFVPQDTQNGPNIVDAFVATDSGAATDSATATDGATATDSATGTATAGDVFQLTFNEALATDVSGATITVVDPDGDTAVIACEDADAVDTTDGVTSATCTLSGDNLVLTITLLEDPEDTNPDDGNAGTRDGANDGFQFPLVIQDTSGLADAEGDEVDLGNGSDTLINKDDRTETVPATA